MKSLDCSTLYLPFLAKALNYAPTSMAQCITCVDDGAPVAGVIYDGYNTISIAAHIWVGGVPSRAWYAAIFDYPFNRLLVSKVVGQVASVNEEAMRLDEHFGFVEEARVKNFSPDGDLVIYTMTKEQCRVLNSPTWTKVVDMVRRVA